MSEKLAITIRLEGNAREFYERYKQHLEEKVPGISHTQAIASIIHELMTLEATA